MTTITTELAQELRERYTPKPAPKCHLCGTKMTIQRSGGGSLTYGCDGRVDTSAEGYQFSEGRSFADDHYAQSRVTMAARGDDDVIALLDALDAKDKQIAESVVLFETLRQHIAELEARPEQQPIAMKDHQIRELVNRLREVAVTYHGTQQLRERIAHVVRSALPPYDAERTAAGVTTNGEQQ